MGYYIENATTRRARVLVYAGEEMLVLTDLSGSGMPNVKCGLCSVAAAAKHFRLDPVCSHASTRCTRPRRQCGISYRSGPRIARHTGSNSISFLAVNKRIRKSALSYAHGDANLYLSTQSVYR